MRRPTYCLLIVEVVGSSRRALLAARRESMSGDGRRMVERRWQTNGRIWNDDVRVGCDSHDARRKHSTIIVEKGR